MDISIASGTYNRLSYLQNMVKSVRQSFRNIYGLSYEIVLTDGGSVDGTIEWCKSQSDIRLIEHGKLMGGVKAFNDAAFAATGQYVIMANDDIEFLNRSIPIAYTYMQLNPDCAIGCFFQDRDRQHMKDDETGKWHVANMPVVRNSKQSSEPYGQVCIVPKWFGDEVGWWGDYLHTYGGDNELSSQAYHLGFKVSPIPGTRIHDCEASDDLRKINNITGGKDPRAIRGMHPDSAKWGDKWRDTTKRLNGPIVRDNPMIHNPNPTKSKERVLYLPIFEQGWDIQKEQKRGLRDALAKVAAVFEYDYFSKNAAIGKDQVMVELKIICSQFRPTIVLSQIHNSDIINSGDLNVLRQYCLPDTKFVNWNGDYWPEQLLDTKGIELVKAFDLMTTVNRDVMESHRSKGINTQYWQIGYEPDGTRHKPSVTHDVVFLASGYSPKRQELGKWLMGHASDSQKTLGLYGSGWPANWSKGQNLYNFIEAAKIYSGAKIALGDSQWPDSGFVSNRIFQILIAGNCTLCHQWFRGIELLGLVDKVNCLIWKDLSDLEQILNFWLLGDKVSRLRAISAKGKKLAIENHSFDNRVSELWSMLNIGVMESEGDWRF